MSEFLKELASLSPKRLALLALELQEKLDAAERARVEPIAIVGMACRFPGGADTPAAFWEFLRRGGDGIVEVPRDRWDIDHYFDDDPAAAGKISSRHGGFIQNIDRFDPHFFGIAPREAVSMDPQQRLLLEVCWEALEDAAQSPLALSGSRTGVFVGITTNDYAQIVGAAGPSSLDAYLMTGNALNFAAGRLSYVLGLQGPSLAVDTACSSSLVTVHLACQSLRNGESSLALAAGVNLILSPGPSIVLSRANMLARDGHCKTFDADADGYVRGEGCGVVVLKRLSEAVADGDRILALVRGSGVNQDGPSSGLTVPNGPAQQALLRDVLGKAGVPPADVDYVEAHGTGTPLGDPIEIGALAAVFGQGRSAERPLRIGAVKTNVGHLESAAGVAGLIKVVLALKHREIPPHLHLKRLNPSISLGAIPATIPTTVETWPSHGRARFAGVSSFGASGTNAHLLIEEAPAADVSRTTDAAADRPRHVVAVSAKTSDALASIARRYAEALASADAPPVSDFCFTANTGRAHFSHRLAVSGASADDLRRSLSEYASTESASASMARGVATSHGPKVGFVFAAHEMPASGIGRELYNTQPTFRAAFDRCAAILAPELDTALTDVFHGEAAAPLDPACAHAAVFAVEYALSELWRTWGVKPAVALGHDIGEFVAATVAGVFGVEDGLKLVAARGRLLHALARGGGILAVEEGERDVVPLLTAFEGVARTVKYQAPQIPVVSSLTGAMATGDDLVTPGYWRRHLRGVAQSANGMKALQAAGVTVRVELGPGQSQWTTLTDAVAQAYVSGVGIDWAGFDADYTRRKVTLPTYPFQRQRFWALQEQRPARTVNASAPQHPLLGQRLRSPLLSGSVVFDAVLDPRAIPYLQDHRVRNEMLAPAAVYAELALAAAREAFAADAIERVEDLAVEESLVLSDVQPAVAQIVLKRDASRITFEVVSAVSLSDGSDDRWTRHASGSLARAAAAPIVSSTLPAIQTRCTEHVEGDAYYAAIAKGGFEMGPRFRAMSAVWRGTTESLGEIRMPGGIPESAELYALHPVIFDACCHVAGQSLAIEAGASYMVVGLNGVQVFKPAANRLWAHATARSSDQGSADTLVADVLLLDESSNVVAAFDGLMFRRVTEDALARAAARSLTDWLYAVAWERKPPAGSSPVPALSSISALAEREMSEFTSDPALAETADALPHVNSLATLYVVRALRDLGWSARPGESYSFADVKAAVNIASRHERLLRRMLEMLEEDGVLVANDTGWVMARALPTEEPDARARELAAAYPSTAAIVGLTSRCGSQLAMVLRGDADPLEILFPGGSFSGLEAIYEHSAGSRMFNRLVQTSVQSVVSRLASDQTLRVVEIGAGTGGTTAGVLPALPPARTRYVFTDLSPAFFDRAAEKFAAYPFVEYRRLDIERAPADQGFAGERFDVVIAANVLHATRSLADTLDHVKELLAPEGLLVVLEATGGSRWLDVTFGLTDGWWRFEDAALRPSHPLLTISRWSELLAEHGFVETAILPPGLDERAAQAIVLGRGPGSAASKAAGSALRQREGQWLVLADEAGLGAAVADGLRSRGADALVLGKHAFQHALQTGSLVDGRPLGGVVHLMSLDSAPSGDTSPERLEADQIQSCGTLLQTVQALLSKGVVAPVWTVTRLSQPAGSHEHPGDLSVAQSPIWGLARVVALEHPELWGGIIDIDDVDVARAADLVIGEIESSDGEDQIARRGGDRFVARLVPSAPPGLHAVSLRADASYLVTGGLGTLGLKLARWLAEHGAKHLVLLGRRGATDPKQKMAIEEIEALGVSVAAVAADVANLEQMSAVFDRFGRDLPGLKGVVHAATANGAIALRDLSVDRLLAMLRPKVSGTWVLHTLTRDVPLDFFVLFSSTTGLLGSSMLGHYAAANTFLDSFAHYRRGCQLPVVAINWGVWEEMRASSDDQARVTQGGLLPLATARALEAFGLLLGANDTQITVASVDWSVLKSVYEAKRRRPFLERVGSRPAARVARAGTEASLVNRLEAARRTERHDLLVDFVRRAASQVLAMPASDVDVDCGLFDLGMDSLMSVDLKRRLEAGVGRSLPSTLAFNHPTVGALVSYLEQQLSHLFEAIEAAEAVAPTETAAADDDNMSEDELAALLADRLARVQ